MGDHSGIRRAVAAMAAASTAAIAGPAVTQEAGEVTAAPRFVLNYSTEFEADTNEDLVADSPGTTVNFDHRLSGRYVAETRLQSISIDSFATGRLGWDPEVDDTVTDFNQGGIDLDYSRRGSRSALTFGGSLRQNEVEANEIIFLDTDGDAVIDEAGLSQRDATVTTIGLNASLETGIDRPLSTTYRASLRDRSYSDSNDPDLYDNRRASVGMTTSLDISPVLTGRIMADYEQYDYDDLEETDGERYSLRTGVTYTVDPTLELDGTIGYSERTEEVTEEGERVEDVTDGLVASLGFTKERPRGDINGEYTRDVREEGIRDSISIGRSLSFPDFELSGRIGLTTLDGGDPDTLFLLSYDRDLANGGLSATVQRRVTTNTVDEERILTLASVDYSRRMTPLTSLNVGLDVARIEETESEGDDQRTELGLTASVNRSLTRDWSLGMGYRARYEELESGDDAVGNSVFVTLGRQFIIRP